MKASTYIQTGKLPHLKHNDLSLIGVAHKISNMFFLSRAINENSENKRIADALQELRQAGLSLFQLSRRESQRIATHLHPDEHIEAAIRGRMVGIGGVLLVATNSRVMYIHDIPLFSSFEEFPYEVLSGVSINRAGYLTSVTVFTNFKKYQIDYINPRQAEQFLSCVESRIYVAKLQHILNIQKEAFAEERY
jgi:hypothetical protein